MDREVLPQLARPSTEAVAAQQQRRVHRAAGHHDGVALDAQAPGPGSHGLDAPGMPALDHDAASADRGIGGGARIPRLGHVGDPRVLLGAGGTTEDAHAGAHAALGVAVDEVARPAQGVGPPLGHQRVVARQLGRHLGHVDLALHPAEVRVELAGREGLEPEAVLPHLEDGGRGTEAGARVDQRGAPHRLAQRQRDRHVAHRDGLGGVPIQERHHRAPSRVEAIGGEVLALLQHHHPHAALRQLLGHRRPAGPGADHAHVGAHHPLAGDGAPVLHALAMGHDHAAPVGVRLPRGGSDAHGLSSRTRSSRPRRTTASASYPKVLITPSSP